MSPLMKYLSEKDEPCYCEYFAFTEGVQTLAGDKVRILTCCSGIEHFPIVGIFSWKGRRNMIGKWSEDGRDYLSALEDEDGNVFFPKKRSQQDLILID